MNFYQLYHGVKQQQSDSIGTLINRYPLCQGAVAMVCDRSGAFGR